MSFFPLPMIHCVMVVLMVACSSSSSPPPGKNRLVFEKSPYLQQHADNPVDWYSWGNEAFEKAKTENKLVFLSIGYSTCHWCHVMEHESFENLDVAKVLNTHFISIKVDREERPDVDRAYMDTVVAMTGHGGWPLSVFLTPQRKPIFGGTYFQTQQFKTLLEQLATVWTKDKSAVENTADQIVKAFTQHIHESKPISSEKMTSLLQLASSQAVTSYDSEYGGFGTPTKFPQEARLLLLLRLIQIKKFESPLKSILIQTLDAMMAGGLYDHIGGGFHRYTVDNHWDVPHFEKMLYNQALITLVLLEAYQLTQHQRFLLTARETLDYVLEKMTSPNGGFYSAQDADTGGHEGTTYVWTWAELTQHLTPEEFQTFQKYFSISEKGNFEGRANVLRFTSPSQWEKKIHDTQLSPILKKLKSIREKRPQPHTDHKIITEWNGLMMSALCLGYRITTEERYLQAARTAATTMKTHLYNAGKLYRRSVDNEVKHDGVVSDYAHFIAGLMDLYQTDWNSQWLSLAIELQATQDRLFWDSKSGGYFDTANHAELPFERSKDYDDNALLNANGVSAINLLRLHQWYLKKEFKEKAEKILASASPHMTKQPFALATLTRAAVFSYHGGRSVAMIGDVSQPPLSSLLKKMNQTLLPHVVLATASDQTNSVPLLQNRPLKNGKPTIYVCEEGICQFPTYDSDEAWQYIVK